MNDNPWFKFYPGDWRNNLALQGCSLAARGLWIEILAIVRAAPREGVLADAQGRPLSVERIAAMVNASKEEVSKLLDELSAAGVAKRLDGGSGALLSPRMARYAQRSEEGRLSAAKRWDRPQEAPNASPIGGTPLAFRHRSDGSSSSDSESGSSLSDPVQSLEEKKAPIRKRPAPPPLPSLPAELDFPDVREALADYLATRKGGRWDAKLTAVRLKQLAAWGRARAVAALRHSAGYQGLFEPTPGRADQASGPAPQRVPDGDATAKYLDELRSTPRGAPPKPMAELLAEAKKRKAP